MESALAREELNQTERRLLSQSKHSLEIKPPISPLTVDDCGKNKVKTNRYELPDTYRKILIHALYGGGRSFLLAYGIRAGFTLLLKLVAVFKGKAGLLEALKESLLHRECWEYGLATGGFSFTWKLVNNAFGLYRTKRDRLNGGLAGALAALWLVALPSSTRKAFSIQMMLRAGQFLYNYHKEKGRLHLPHGDVILFGVSCAQIMYALMLRPGTIPRSYYSWMLMASNSHPAVLDSNRKLVRSEGQWLSGDAYDLVRLCQTLGGSSMAIENCRETIEQTPAHQLSIPCSLIHCRDIRCLRYNIWLFGRVIFKMMPVNFALNIVPQALLKFPKFIKSPVSATQKSFWSALQSSVFLGGFISLFQALICMQRYLLLPEPKLSGIANPSAHKFWYYSAGAIASSLSILLEQKRRRGELALYVLPKAMESLYMTLLDRKSLKYPLPDGCEVLLSMCAFGILMAWYQEENSVEHMNPTVQSVMKHLIGEN